MYWQVAEPLCQSLAQHGLWSFNCHMAVSVLTAVMPQMGCRVDGALVLEKAGVVHGVKKPGVDLRAGDAIRSPCKNTEDMVACGRATT